MKPAQESGAKKCPGCGGLFPDIEGPTHRYMVASPGCWAAFGEVLEREYGDPKLQEVHRLSVDAYAAQHPGTRSRQSIHSVGLHLVRLYLQLEGGLSTQKANDAMLVLGRHKQGLCWLEPPASLGEVTVADVVHCRGLEEHRTAVRAWARSVLAAWSAHRPTVERWAEKWLASKANNDVGNAGE